MPGLKSQFIPAPIDGLNLVTTPDKFLPTEARRLDNYYIYDWGIRERGPVWSSNLPGSVGTVSGMFAFTNTTYQATILGTSDGWIYRVTPSGVSNLGFEILSDPGSTGKGSSFNQAFSFNKVIFIPEPVYTIATYNLDTDAFSETSFTIPGSNYFASGFAFKQRAYFIDVGSVGAGTSSIYYGGVAAITGALTSFNIGQFFQKGKHLTFGSSWSYNQGLQNDELMVLGNDAGEIFIYSGDYPAASNWQLVSRIDVPTMLNLGKNARQPIGFIKIGQDIYINTNRGVIPLSALIAGKGDELSYYSISRKIGPVLTGARADRSANYPFAYFAGTNPDDTSGPNVLWVLNYERGAWSKFNVLSGANATTITNISCATRPLLTNFAQPLASYVFVSTAETSEIFFFKESDLVNYPESAPVTYRWWTPFNNWDSPLKKASKLLRVLGRVIAGTLFSNAVVGAHDFEEPAITVSDTQSMALIPAQGYRVQDMKPPVAGRRLSYEFNKTGTEDINELAGVEVFYEEGSGVY